MAGGSGGGAGGTTPAPPLSTNQRNAYDTIKNMLAQWGLQGLARHVLTWVRQGYDSAAINYQLQQTNAYKQRFSGNELRIKNGLAPLSPGDYLSVEASYRQVLQAAGLPKSFYSSPSDYATLIGNGISAQEVQSRAQQAAQFVQSTDPNARAALSAYHGIDTAHLIAYYLDPKQSAALLQKQSSEALLGSAALDQGLHLPGLGKVDNYLDRGYDPNHAQADFQTVAHDLPTLNKLGSIYGSDFSQADEEDAVLGGLASANRKRKQLISDEAGAFSGSGGGGTNSLAQASTGTY